MTVQAPTAAVPRARVAATTAGGGLYTFRVAPGSYIVEFEAPTGSIFSPQDQGIDDTADSDANPTDGRTALIGKAARTDTPRAHAGSARSHSRVYSARGASGTPLAAAHAIPHRFDHRRRRVVVAPRRTSLLQLGEEEKQRQNWKEGQQRK